MPPVQGQPDRIAATAGVVSTWLGRSRPPIVHLMAAIRAMEPARSRCGRCGQPIGPGEQTARGCGRCRGRRRCVSQVVSVGGYEGPLAEAIVALKYQRDWPLAAPLGRLLADRLRASIPALSGPEANRWRVVPVPMPTWRRRYRGIDHARELARAVAGDLGLRSVQPLRKAGGRPQVALARGARLRAGASPYRLRRSDRCRFGGFRSDLRGRSVILVDDVLTTGGTIESVASVVSRAGSISVIAGVLAVTDFENLSPGLPPA